MTAAGTLGKQHELGRKVGDTTSTFLHSTVCVKLPASARVVKLVDTRDLKSLDPNPVMPVRFRPWAPPNHPLRVENNAYK